MGTNEYERTYDLTKQRMTKYQLIQFVNNYNPLTKLSDYEVIPLQNAQS